MFGLSAVTSFFVFGTPILGLILGIIYALTFKIDSDVWWTFEDIGKKKK